MKYLSNQPIVFGYPNSPEYDNTWERVFGKKQADTEHQSTEEKKDGNS